MVKALKFKIKRLLISLRLKKEKYSWFIVSNELNQGDAVFKKPSKKRELTYQQWEQNQKEEKEITELISTINEFLDICKTSSEYKSFITKHYEKQGYTVWEYSKERDDIERNRMDLVLKKNKNILFVECRNCNTNIDMEQVTNFENQAERFVEENQIFKNYKIKLRYTMASLLLEEEVYSYMKANSDKIDYDIVKLKNK